MYLCFLKREEEIKDCQKKKEKQKFIYIYIYTYMKI